MDEWKKSYETPPSKVLLEMIFSEFDPRYDYTLGYVVDGTVKGGDGEVRWHTLHDYLGRECDQVGPRWWRICPDAKERAKKEISEFAGDVWSLVTKEDVDGIVVIVQKKEEAAGG